MQVTFTIDFGSPLTLVLLVALALYLLWVFYLAVMNLWRAKRLGRLSTPAKIFGYPTLLIGYVLDFIGCIIFSVLLLDMMRETTVTAKFIRIANGPDCWQKRFVLWFADDMLDDFDPTGVHIKVKA